MSVVPSPQERLRHTRQELRELLVTRIHYGVSNEFPRSATMRLLLGGAGRGVAGAIASAAVIGMAPGARKLLNLIPISTLARLWLQRRRSNRS
jgi:hypothetical protein